MLMVRRGITLELGSQLSPSYGIPCSILCSSRLVLVHSRRRSWRLLTHRINFVITINPNRLAVERGKLIGWWIEGAVEGSGGMVVMVVVVMGNE